MYIFTILKQMVMLFVMMGIGFWLFRTKHVDDKFCKQMSWVVVNVFNPLLAVYGVLNGKGSIELQDLFLNVILVLIYFGILILFGHVLVFILKPEVKDRNVFQLMTTFGNVGFMGIPVICSIYGISNMIYITLYVVFYNIFLYTYGIALAAKSRPQNEQKQFSIKQFFNWGTISCLIAIVLFFIPFDTPDFAMNFLDYMGNATIPLSMILIGISIAQSDIVKMFTNAKMYFFVILRMVVLPALVLLVAKGFITNEVLLGVFILELSMPVGSVVVLIAKENGADAELSTNGMVLSTLLSIITIPIVCMFLPH